MLLGRVLHEIVSPSLPRRNSKLRRIGRTRCTVAVVLGLQRIQENRWQYLENTLVAIEDKRVKEDSSRNAIADLFRNSLHNRASKTVSDEDDIIESALPNAGHNGVDTVIMGDTRACLAWSTAGERWRVCTMALCGKVANDLFPSPSAVPCSVNQNKRFTHCAFPFSPPC